MSELSTNPAGSSEAGSFTERLMALGRRGEEPAPPPPAEESLEITERDIIFDCPRCYGELIVDRDGEQMETSCIHCGATLLVPKYMGPPSKVGKVQAQYAPGGNPSSSGSPHLGTNTEYRPVTQEYPTGGPATGDYPTGATAAMIRNLGETVAPTSSSPVTGEEMPAPVAADTSPAASDKATFLRPDGSLTDDVLREMRELNFQELDMEGVVKQLETVRRHLKENNSQVTEVTGYVNQTSIKLHRFKLQLDRLKKRNSEIHKEMRALKARSVQLGGQAE
jgi:hypothetical protein